MKDKIDSGHSLTVATKIRVLNIHEVRAGPAAINAESKMYVSSAGGLSLEDDSQFKERLHGLVLKERDRLLGSWSPLSYEDNWYPSPLHSFLSNHERDPIARVRCFKGSCHFVCNTSTSFSCCILPCAGWFGYSPKVKICKSLNWRRLIEAAPFHSRSIPP